jgi:hypothetical protein
VVGRSRGWPEFFFWGHGVGGGDSNFLRIHFWSILCWFNWGILFGLDGLRYD